MLRAATGATSRKGRNRSRIKKDLVERLREATDEGMAISIYQIQKRMNGGKYLFLICQHRLILESRIWHRYGCADSTRGGPTRHPRRFASTH